MGHCGLKGLTFEHEKVPHLKYHVKDKINENWGETTDIAQEWDFSKFNPIAYGILRLCQIQGWDFYPTPQKKMLPLLD